MFHTSVPRWTAEFSPPVAARVVVVAARRTATVEGVLAALDAPAEAVSPDELDGVLENARVGWHFVAVGTDAVVSAVRARLLAAGAIDAEITAVVDDPGSRAVFCTHCRAVTRARVTVGDTLDCSGCTAPLVVYHHFSRRLGAYMGYRVDAEELPDAAHEAGKHTDNHRRR